VTHGLAAAANRGWLSLREWEASYLAAQLEAEIAQLKDALARRQQIGVATGCWPSASLITPSGPGHCWYASPRTAMSKVRDIAQAMINAHCSRLGPTDIEILSAIEMHMPDGLRLIGARVDGQQPTSESSQ